MKESVLVLAAATNVIDYSHSYNSNNNYNGEA